MSEVRFRSGRVPDQVSGQVDQVRSHSPLFPTLVPMPAERPTKLPERESERERESPKCHAAAVTHESFLGFFGE